MKLNQFLLFSGLLLSTSIFAADDTSMIPPPHCGPHAASAGGKASQAAPKAAQATTGDAAQAPQGQQGSQEQQGPPGQ